MVPNFVPSADTNTVVEILRQILGDLAIAPRFEPKSADCGPAVVLAFVFSSATMFFVWYRCQRVEHLPLLIAMPPNIYGIVICFKSAIRRCSLDT